MTRNRHRSNKEKRRRWVEHDSKIIWKDYGHPLPEHDSKMIREAYGLGVSWLGLILLFFAGAICLLLLFGLTY